MEKSSLGIQLLAQGAGHEQIPGIDDQCNHCQLQIGCLLSYSGKTGKFPGGSVEQQACEGRLESIETTAAGGGDSGIYTVGAKSDGPHIGEGAFHYVAFALQNGYYADGRRQGVSPLYSIYCKCPEGAGSEI